MLRSALGKKVHPTSSPNLSGGAFASPMTSIGTDSSVTADLGMVRKDSLEGVLCSGLHDSDVSCCQVIVSCAFIFVMFQFVIVLVSVDEERLQRQVLGPRVPVSRFRNLDDASIDLLPLDGFEPWVYSDLVQNPFQETDNLRRYCETALTAVSVGDLNAVYAVEAAHRRQLLSVESLQTRSMLRPVCAFHRSALLGDVFVDDLFIPAMVHFSRLHLKGNFCSCPTR